MVKDQLADSPIRCQWGFGDALLAEYHDTEWGMPQHDDRRLFEMLVLDGAQAGLNWLLVLKKRARYRVVFDDFDPQRVASYGEEKVQELLSDAGIVRNRLKIASAISNAQAFLRVQEELGSFDRYLWGFVEGRPIVNHWRSLSEIPARTAVSDALSKDLQRRGFKFVGSTICYAIMQSVGMVNDHTVDCFRWSELAEAKDGALIGRVGPGA